MLSFRCRLPALLLACCIGLVNGAVLYAADDGEDPYDPGPTSAQSHRLGSVDVVVLNADCTPAEIRRETTPLVTALLTMTKVRKDEKCTAVLWSRRPAAKCAIIKTKSKAKKKKK